MASKKKQLKQDVEKGISEAVEQLTSSATKEAEKKEQGRTSFRDSQRQKKTYLWVGVVVVTVAVFAVWAINMWTLFYDATNSPEKSDTLFRQAGQDVGKIFGVFEKQVDGAFASAKEESEVRAQAEADMLKAELEASFQAIIISTTTTSSVASVTSTVVVSTTLE